MGPFCGRLDFAAKPAFLLDLRHRGFQSFPKAALSPLLKVGDDVLTSDFWLAVKGSTQYGSLVRKPLFLCDGISIQTPQQRRGLLDVMCVARFRRSSARVAILRQRLLLGRHTAHNQPQLWESYLGLRSVVGFAHGGLTMNGSRELCCNALCPTTNAGRARKIP